MPWNFIIPRQGTARIMRRLLVPAAVFAVALVLPAAAAAGSPASAQSASGTGFRPAAEIRVPANAAADPTSILIRVACTRRGDCSAGGSYNDADGNTQAMAVTQSRGRWGRAVEITLPANAAAEPYAEVNGVACTRPGDCVAVGYYYVTGGYDQGFIVTQTRGTWGRARQATPPANAGAATAELFGVACTSGGACQAAGSYTDHAKHYQAMVISEAGGRWGRGSELRVPPGAAANPGANLNGISCVRAGECVAAGYYYTSNSNEDDYLAMGAVESHGRWGRASRLRLPANAAAHDSIIGGVSCVAAGPCLAAGGYATASSFYGMAAAESGGRWGRAAEILARPAHAKSTSVDGVSCVTARLCIAAGGYSTTSSNSLAYLVTWSAGRWQQAGGVSLPANAQPGPARSFFYDVGCASDGYCAAVGDYFTKTAQLVPMAATRP
ncbi:MAG: hypothetical protein ACLQFR_12770 [Streptosporangiaceae bacterium]